MRYVKPEPDELDKWLSEALNVLQQERQAQAERQRHEQARATNERNVSEEWATADPDPATSPGDDNAGRDG